MVVDPLTYKGAVFDESLYNGHNLHCSSSHFSPPSFQRSIFQNISFEPTILYVQLITDRYLRKVRLIPTGGALAFRYIRVKLTWDAQLMYFYY